MTQCRCSKAVYERPLPPLLQTDRAHSIASVPVLKRGERLGRVGTFHNELKDVIDNSKSLEAFNAGIMKLTDRWQVDPKLLPPLPKR